MFGFLKSKGKPDVTPSTPAGAGVIPWKDNATLPIPDWDAIAPDKTTDEDLHIFWNAVARGWLAELNTRLGSAYKIAESAEFLLLGALSDRQLELVLNYAERTRNRVFKLLPDIARDEGYGKTVLLVIDSEDRYYEYVTHYDADTPDGTELSFSSGMFIDSGYGHFVFVADDLTRIEPVIAHELTHCLVRHLPLPAWVNEGIAVNTERRLCPPLSSRYTLAEWKSKHAGFWNADTIQEFWSGKSWRRPNDGNLLSYELATTIIGLAAKDWPAFASFVCAADAADAGDGASLQHLGVPLATLAEVVLGPGEWAPDSARWQQGVEHGQFRIGAWSDSTDRALRSGNARHA